MAGIHRYAYTQARPATAADNPLFLAPGATVTVHLTGTGTLASLFTDAALTTPLANPFVSDADAFYQYYVNPSLGDVDETLSGTGIDTPYTLPAVLNLDPRVSGTAGDVTGLTAALDAEIATRAAQVLALQQIGVRYPLGGSLAEGIEGTGRQTVVNPIVITVDGDQFAGYTLTVFVEGMTADAGVSLTPVLRNLTTAVDAGTGTPITGIVPTAQSFTAALAAGVNQYELQLTPSAGTAFLYLNGYVALAVP